LLRKKIFLGLILLINLGFVVLGLSFVGVIVVAYAVWRLVVNRGVKRNADYCKPDNFEEGSIREGKKSKSYPPTPFPKILFLFF